jgi:hypothetical protein
MARRLGRFSQLSCGLVLTFLVASPAPQAFAQKQKPKEPLWTHAFDLSCRKFGESEFTDKTQKFGVEVFKDTNTGSGLYVSQVGSFAAAAGFDGITAAIKGSKGPEWISGLDLPSRKAGEKEFTKDTRVYSMEVFYDANVGNWVYITNNGQVKDPKGNVSAAPAPKGVKPAPGNLKAPKWLHSVDLSCRKGGVREWQNAHKFGIEIYRDNNTGNLIYICDTGAISVLPDKRESKTADGKAPVWLHGLDLYCRKYDEMDFTKMTRKFGVEVFRDENNGNLIYLSETGDLAVLPSPNKDLKAPTPNVKEPKWTHGLNLSCRKAGEKEFTPKTRVYGAEVFRDENTGVTLYIAETGSITAIPTKQ